MDHPAIIQLTFLFLQVPSPELSSRFRFVQAGNWLSGKLVSSVAPCCSSTLSLGASSSARVTSANQAIGRYKPYLSPTGSNFTSTSSALSSGASSPASVASASVASASVVSASAASANQAIGRYKSHVSPSGSDLTTTFSESLKL